MSTILTCAFCGSAFERRTQSRRTSRVHYCSFECHRSDQRRQSTESFASRFWANVCKTDECWLWLGKPDDLDGYGKMNVGGRSVWAHHASYEWAYGPVPDGLFVLHKCDVKLCVRPEHLYAGTILENVRDARERGRLPTGNRNGMYTHPESRPYGDRNGTHTHPECVRPRTRAKASKEVPNVA